MYMYKVKFWFKNDMTVILKFYDYEMLEDFITLNNSIIVGYRIIEEN